MITNILKKYLNKLLLINKLYKNDKLFIDYLKLNKLNLDNNINLKLQYNKMLYFNLLKKKKKLFKMYKKKINNINNKIYYFNNKFVLNNFIINLKIKNILVIKNKNLILKNFYFLVIRIFMNNLLLKNNRLNFIPIYITFLKTNFNRRFIIHDSNYKILHSKSVGDLSRNITKKGKRSRRNYYKFIKYFKFYIARNFALNIYSNKKKINFLNFRRKFKRRKIRRIFRKQRNFKKYVFKMFIKNIDKKLNCFKIFNFLIINIYNKEIKLKRNIYRVINYLKKLLKFKYYYQIKKKIININKIFKKINNFEKIDNFEENDNFESIKSYKNIEKTIVRGKYKRKRNIDKNKKNLKFDYKLQKLNIENNDDIYLEEDLFLKNIIV